MEVKLTSVCVPDPPDEVLRKLFTQNGGKYTNYNNGAKTSYVIATNLSAPSKR